MRAKQIDFHAVEPHQRAIDARLKNWAQWLRGGNAPACSPMFRLAPPPPRVRRDMLADAEPLNRPDAVKVAVAVQALPTRHRAAVNWAYVKPVSPAKACRSIGATMEELAQLLRDGRQMLINRDV
jgi:DNA-directed RNA polymerase specialized sigma24 family protein